LYVIEEHTAQTQIERFYITGTHIFHFAFSISVDERGIEIVRKYIENQRVHHTKKDKELFEEELIRLLEENNIPYDLMYLFD
jgi:hypothetical protein